MPTAPTATSASTKVGGIQLVEDCGWHRGMSVGKLLSVNVGMPKDVPWQGKTVFTGVFKEPATGPRRVRKLNVDGDGQGDLAGHGGEQRAVFVYQIDVLPVLGTRARAR